MSKDSVFGEMTYNNSWEREEEEIFFSKIRKYKIVAKAYPGQQILDIQRDACTLRRLVVLSQVSRNLHTKIFVRSAKV